MFALSTSGDTKICTRKNKTLSFSQTLVRVVQICRKGEGRGFKQTLMRWLGTWGTAGHTRAPTKLQHMMRQHVTKLAASYLRKSGDVHLAWPVVGKRATACSGGSLHTNGGRNYLLVAVPV
jgi:hypothetical protein